MDFAALSQKMIILFFCILTGFVCAKAGVMDTDTNKKLSTLIVKLTNPMQILASVLAGERLLSNGEVFALTGVGFCCYAVLIALSFLVPKLLHVPQKQSGLYRFMFIFSNVAFIGYPIVESLLGKSAVFYVSLFVLFFHMFCWSYGVSLIEGKGKFCFSRRIFREPCVLASLFAYAFYLTGWQAPAIFATAADYIGALTSPIAMLIIGCSLAQMRFSAIFGNWRIYVLSILKLVVVPVLAFFALRPILKNELMLCVTTVVLCMPVATNTTIISYQYGADEELASTGVFLSTLLCMVTIPLLMKLLFGA